MSKKAVLVAATGAGLVLGALALFLLTGCRMLAVMSPSMGTAAPVGTLVVVQPSDTYRVGDVVSFSRGSKNYTHRIVAVDADGAMTTKGDLNAVPDATPVHMAEIVGKAVWIAPGLGWVLQGLPWLVLGFVVVLALSLIGRMPRSWRWALRISGWTLVACMVAFWLRPWVNVDLLGFRPADAEAGVLLHVVNTGLFPLDVQGARLTSGEDAVVHVIEQNEWGIYRLIPTTALTWWEQALMFVTCLSPMLFALLVKQDEPEAEAAGESAEEKNPQRRRLIVAIIVGSVIAAVGVMSTTVSHAAVTSAVRNSSNTAGTKTFFNCRNAIASLSAADTFFAYGMTPTGMREIDLSPNGHTGRYLAAPATSTSVGCLNDSPKTSVSFDGVSQCVYMNSATNTSQNNPNTFSIEAWFRTSSKSNGRIVGFGNIRNSAADGTYDRHIYLDRDGRLVFGVYPGSVRLVYTATGKDYTDDQWHHVVATLSASGQALYVDGALAMKNAAVTTGENASGYWKVGCGNLTNWQNAATAQAGSGTLDYSGPSYFTGQIQYVAVYNTALSQQQVTEHYLAGLP